MQLKKIRLSNFQAFGPTPEEITFEEITYILGPNGAGKTTVLEALSRLFSPIAAQRRIEALDFHVPIAKPDEDPLDSPTLWIEADFEFPEAGEADVRPAVPPFFAHMSLATAAGPPSMRVRLTAVLEPDGNVTEQIDYVLDANESGVPLRTARMSRTDRAHIEVHYLPARRDPSEQISYASASLLGRTLRAATWKAEEELLADLTEQITTTLAGNAAVANIGVQLAEDWVKLHRGDFFKDPTLAFGSKDIESALRQLTLRFGPGHGADSLQFERLSDGQKSLLYISLVLAWQAVGRKVLRGEDKSVDINRLRPPVHTIFAIEDASADAARAMLGTLAASIVVTTPNAAVSTVALVSANLTQLAAWSNAWKWPSGTALRGIRQEPIYWPAAKNSPLGERCEPMSGPRDGGGNSVGLRIPIGLVSDAEAAIVEKMGGTAPSPIDRYAQLPASNNSHAGETLVLPRHDHDKEGAPPGVDVAVPGGRIRLVVIFILLKARKCSCRHIDMALQFGVVIPPPAVARRVYRLGAVAVECVRAHR